MSRGFLSFQSCGALSALYGRDSKDPARGATSDSSARPVYLGVVSAAEASTEKSAEKREEQGRDGDDDAGRACACEVAHRGGRSLRQVADNLGRSRGQEAGEDHCDQGEYQGHDERPGQHHRPVASPVEAGEAAGHVPAEKIGEEDQDAEHGEAREDRGAELALRKLGREAEGDEHEPRDGREDRGEDYGEDEPQEARQPVHAPVHVPEPVLALLDGLEVASRVRRRVPYGVGVMRRPDNAGLFVFPGGPPRRPSRGDRARGPSFAIGGSLARLLVVTQGTRSAALLTTLFWPLAHLDPFTSFRRLMSCSTSLDSTVHTYRSSPKAARYGRRQRYQTPPLYIRPRIRPNRATWLVRQAICNAYTRSYHGGGL